MKSFRLLLLVILLIALQIVPVMAAADDYDLTKAGEAYTLVYKTGDSAGTQVVLIMMSGNTLTAGKVPIDASGDIVYIDQTTVKTGTGSNTVTFSGFIPMATDKDYYSLYLGGLTGGPVWVATISASGIIVSGTVEYFGDDTLTVELYNSTKTNVLKTVTVTKAAAKDATAPFLITKIDLGTYYLKTSKSRCLSYFEPITVKVEDLMLTGVAYKLYAGDIDGNSAINAFDLSILLKDFGKTGELLNLGSDIDENTAVNVYDLSALLKNFGMSVI